MNAATSTATTTSQSNPQDEDYRSIPSIENCAATKTKTIYIPLHEGTFASLPDNRIATPTSPQLHYNATRRNFEFERSVAIKRLSLKQLFALRKAQGARQFDDYRYRDDNRKQRRYLR